MQYVRIGHLLDYLCLVVLHGKLILERYRGTQPLKTILFHVLLVSILDELCATAEQCAFASDGQQEHSCHFQLTDIQTCSKS